MYYYEQQSQDGSVNLGSVSDITETQSAFEMRPWPAHYSSQASITPSYKSFMSAYTPSQASFFVLPVTSEIPDQMRRPQDNWGIAFCSLFVNPIFGVIAILLSEMSRQFFNKKQYIQAAKYGNYAKGAALGGIISMIVVLALIIAQVIHYHTKFSY